MPKPKYTDRLNGYRSKTFLYATCKRPTSDLRKHTNRKSWDGKRYFKEMGIKRKWE